MEVTQPFLIAAALYLVAHFLRALRFWLLMETTDLSLRKTFVTFQVTNTLGSVISPFVTEVARILVLMGLSGPERFLEVISMSVFCRLLDFLVASSPLLINAMFFSSGVGLEPIPSLMFVLFGMLLGMICYSQHALSFVRQVIVSRGRSALHLRLIHGLTAIEKGFYRFLDRPTSTLIFNLFLTVLIWGLDVFALENLTRMPLWSQVVQWSEHASGRFFHVLAPDINENFIWQQLIEPQLAISAILLLITFVMWLKSNTWQPESWHAPRERRMASGKND